MSIELSPPTRLLTVLDTLAPSDSSTANTEPGGSATAPSTLYDVADTRTDHLSEGGDQGSALLARDFGSAHLTTPDQDDLPQIDTTAAANLQAQQWVQFILSAWV